MLPVSPDTPKFLMPTEERQSRLLGGGESPPVLQEMERWGSRSDSEPAAQPPALAGMLPREGPRPLPASAVCGALLGSSPRRGSAAEELPPSRARSGQGCGDAPAAVRDPAASAWPQSPAVRRGQGVPRP